MNEYGKISAETPYSFSIHEHHKNIDGNCYKKEYLRSSHMAYQLESIKNFAIQSCGCYQ